MKCSAIRAFGKSKGEPCGREVVGFVAPGHGRCGYHLTAVERLRVAAVLQAERQLATFRMCAPLSQGQAGEDEQGEQPRGYEDADGTPWIEVDDRDPALLE